jgi:DNA polymerase-3 subunit epsilon
MLNMKLERPIVFFDLETTGTNHQRDRVVEISVVKCQPDGSHEVKTRRINPEMPIPEESSAIHGIRDEDVRDAPTFKAISKNLYIYLEGCDLGGYNIVRFDIPVLVEEFRRAGLEFSVKNRRIVDPYVIFCRKEPRSLAAAYQLYCGKELIEAHSAESDVLATIEVLDGQFERYPDLSRETAELDALCNPVDPSAIDETGRFRWRNGEAVVGFGKNSGAPLKQIATDPGFLQWMIRQDFADDAKRIASDALRGKFPDAPPSNQQEEKPGNDPVS